MYSTGKLEYTQESEIFIGPNYYMRLKHMVKDKINYRALGPRTSLTRQPVQIFRQFLDLARSDAKFVAHCLIMALILRFEKTKQQLV